MNRKSLSRATGAVVQSLETRRLFAGPGSIAGVVFNDINRDGLYTPDDEPTRRVNAVWADYDGNGVRDPNEPSAYSDARGVYTFVNLAARTYHVRRVFPSGYVESSTPRYVTVPAAGGGFSNVDIGSKTK